MRNEAHAVMGADDDVIVHVYVEQGSSFGNPFAALDIRFARSGISRGVIVDEYDGCRTECERTANDFSRGDWDLVDRALREQDIAKKSVAAIQVEPTELLGLLAGVNQPEIFA